MSNDDRGQGGKQHLRVQVIHFPKKLKAGSLEHSETRTVPNFRHPAPEDRVTEALYAPERAVEEAMAARSAGGAAKKSKGKSKDKRKAEKKGRDTAGTDPSTPVAERPATLEELSLYGHQLFEAGQLEEARTVFEGLVGRDVLDPFRHTMLGTIYLALGHPDRALALFEASLQIDRNDLAALVYRGEIRLHRGKLKAALTDLHRALQLGLAEDPFVDRAKRLIKMAQGLAKRQRKA